MPDDKPGLKERSWPKVAIEIGGPPPSRKKPNYRPWLFVNWFGGDGFSRRQFTLIVPFLQVRLYP